MKNNLKQNLGQMKESNEKGRKKRPRKALIIAGSIVLLLAAVIILVPKLLFTDYEGLPTTGPYGVKQVSAILVDEKRLETFEDDGSYREVPVYFYYPDVTDSAAGEQEEFPLVIFSHGAFGYYQSNTSTYMELASHGYVVISLDHPYHSFFTKDTEGKTITVNTEFLQQVMYINENGTAEDEIIALSHEWLELRLGDMDFALDSVKQAKTLLTGTWKETAGAAGASQAEENRLPDYWFVNGDSATEQEILAVLSMTDIEHIGLMGHSLGGATSVTLGRTRDDIDAVIDLDGTMLGEEFGFTNGEYEFYEEAYPVPLLAVNNEEHHWEGREVETLYVNRVVLENAVDARYTYFKGSGHMNFTDLPLFSPALASLLGTGEVDARECIITMNEVILDFFQCYLKDRGEVTVKECY
ncbi:MAG: hypothetical protein J6J42_13165 [Lachnospiraceae bacterium]|nr:hypothetical protein [Lachnospiraceae bacterium]